jgi:hypothetical protein
LGSPEPPEAEDDEELDPLDEALMETFPASDPIAIFLERP